MCDVGSSGLKPKDCSTRQATERKAVLLRIDPTVHTALQRWASSELRSFNAQVEYLLNKALANAGRLPSRSADRR
jgi:hypothetical protein